MTDTKKTTVKKVTTKTVKPAAKKVAAKATEAKKVVPTSLKLRGASKTVKPVAKAPIKKAKVEATVPVTPKETSLNASVYDLEGKVAGHVQLPEEIFNAKINNLLMSQAVRVYLANQRQGTSKVKDRSEVDRTTKKIYAQKGTGQARHGSRRAPIYVGGGKVFGPTPRDFSLNLSKKMRVLALVSALSSKLKDGEIKIVKDLETIQPKTKIMAEILKKLGTVKESKVLLVMSKTGKEIENVYRAGRNIEGVEIVSASSLNTYKVLDNKLILFMKDSIDVLRKIFVKN